jgi:hypothetical protein
MFTAVSASRASRKRPSQRAPGGKARDQLAQLQRSLDLRRTAGLFVQYGIGSDGTQLLREWSLHGRPKKETAAGGRTSLVRPLTRR